MRTLTLTLTLKPENGEFDPLTGDQLAIKIDALVGSGLDLGPHEYSVEVIADAYEPTVPK